MNIYKNFGFNSDFVDKTSNHISMGDCACDCGGDCSWIVSSHSMSMGDCNPVNGDCDCACECDCDGGDCNC